MEADRHIIKVMINLKSVLAGGDLYYGPPASSYQLECLSSGSNGHGSLLTQLLAPYVDYSGLIRVHGRTFGKA